MQIAFIYRYVWGGESRAYSVTHTDGVTVVRNFNGEEGAIVSSVPAGRMAEIQARIDLTIDGLASFGVAP
jgi:hypothetical protein